MCACGLRRLYNKLLLGVGSRNEKAFECFAIHFDIPSMRLESVDRYGRIIGSQVSEKCQVLVIDLRRCIKLRVFATVAESCQYLSSSGSRFLNLLRGQLSFAGCTRKLGPHRRPRPQIRCKLSPFENGTSSMEGMRIQCAIRVL